MLLATRPSSKLDLLTSFLLILVSSTDGVAMPCYLLVYEYVRLRDKNLWARFSKQYFIVLNSTKTLELYSTVLYCNPMLNV
jgi:hypothetical protein